MEPPDGLDVVTEYVGARAEHRRERVLLDSEEVRREDLDPASGSFRWIARIVAA